MRHIRNITRVFLVAITAFSLLHRAAFGQTATSNQIADAATRAIAAIQRCAGDVVRQAGLLIVSSAVPAGDRIRGRP